MANSLCQSRMQIVDTSVAVVTAISWFELKPMIWLLPKLIMVGPENNQLSSNWLCSYLQLCSWFEPPLPSPLAATSCSISNNCWCLSIMLLLNGDKILKFVCYMCMMRSGGILIDWGQARAWGTLFLHFLINCIYATLKSWTLYYKFCEIILWLNSIIVVTYHNSINKVQ